MKYLLFVNFANGLKHNCEYENLDEITESLTELIQDEGLDIQEEDIPEANNIKKYLEDNDDYCRQFSNGIWYHIQIYPVFT